MLQELGQKKKKKGKLDLVHKWEKEIMEEEKIAKGTKKKDKRKKKPAKRESTPSPEPEPEEAKPELTEEEKELAEKRWKQPWLFVWPMNLNPKVQKLMTDLTKRKKAQLQSDANKEMHFIEKQEMERKQRIADAEEAK